MSDSTINIDQLNIATTLSDKDALIIEASNIKTSIINFENVILGKDNVSFTDDIDSNALNFKEINSKFNTGFIANSANWQHIYTTVQENSASWSPPAESSETVGKVLYAHETRPEGTNCGSIPNDRWAFRTFDTHYSNIDNLKINGERFYLPIGGYEVYITCPGQLAYDHKVRLRNVTPYGTNENELIGSGGCNVAHSKGWFKHVNSIITGLITINEEQSINGCWVEHRARLGVAANPNNYAMGYASKAKGFRTNSREIYSIAIFRQIREKSIIDSSAGEVRSVATKDDTLGAIG